MGKGKGKVHDEFHAQQRDFPRTDPHVSFCQFRDHFLFVAMSQQEGFAGMDHHVVAEVRTGRHQRAKLFGTVGVATSLAAQKHFPRPKPASMSQFSHAGNASRRQIDRPPRASSVPLDLDIDRVEEWLGSLPGQLSGNSHVDIALAQLQRIVNLIPTPESTPLPRQDAVPASSPAPATDPLQLLKEGGYAKSVRAWIRQIIGLTRRADAAEARLRALQAKHQAYLQESAALGRRFGQRQHESFAAFVVRLGMTAKAQPLARVPNSGPMPFDTSAGMPLSSAGPRRQAEDVTGQGPRA